jgi:hypothetical protein
MRIDGELTEILPLNLTDALKKQFAHVNLRRGGYLAGVRG